MDGRPVEIDGETFDLSDPEDKKRAIRAWLKARSRERMGISLAGEETPGKEGGLEHVRAEGSGD